jgi:hypothetical protein
MQLRGPQTRFELELLRVPRDSAEWCGVHIKVETPHGRWAANDNCLQGFEVERLADWLDAIGRGTTTERECWFTEPELGFQVLDSDSKRLRVNLSWKFRPKWAPMDRVEDFHVEFPITGQVLQTAAEALRAQLKARARGKK